VLEWLGLGLLLYPEKRQLSAGPLGNGMEPYQWFVLRWVATKTAEPVALEVVPMVRKVLGVVWAGLMTAGRNFGALSFVD
jgi:hypothetical protein